MLKTSPTHNPSAVIRILAAAIMVVLADPVAKAATAGGPDLDKLIGQPAEVAPSAYQYRADRKAGENAPESWLAVMRFAGQPLNKPADTDAPAVRKVLNALLWEEIRPVQQVELSWPADASRRPAPADVVLTTLDNQGSASSWWNNLKAIGKPVKPTVSSDGTTWVYDLKTPTCGIVLSAGGAKSAADFDVPQVWVWVADVWKKMEVEIEWGFDQAAAGKDFSGRIETYDGRVAGLRSLDGDAGTTVAGAGAWRSVGKGAARRGIKFDLLYLGVSKWRKVMPFTSQRDAVARTIVTLWTEAGNFSFLAADLENGPILAPEYGFFVRRTSSDAAPSVEPETKPRDLQVPLAAKMDSIAGGKELKGWGSDECPWFGGNPADQPVSVNGIAVPARSLAMHPGTEHDVAVGWHSPIQGLVKVKASVAHGQRGSDGIEWWIVQDAKAGRTNLAQGATSGTGSQTIPAEADAQALDKIAVVPGDLVSLVVGRKGLHHCDATIIEFTLTEVGGRGRVWNLTQDVVGTLHADNPHADGRGDAGVWHFCSEPPESSPQRSPSQPPIVLASRAASAREFIQELQARKLSTIRQQTHAHEEHTWEGAVTAMCGANLPPHPSPFQLPLSG